MSQIVKSIKEGFAGLRRIREQNIARARADAEREKGKREVTCSICGKTCVTYDPVRNDGVAEKFAHYACVAIQKAEQDAKRQRIDEIKQALTEYFAAHPLNEQ
jgi:hypothetical protein